MKKSDKEIVKLTARQVFYSVSVLALPFFEASSVYRVSASKFREEAGAELANYSRRLHYLRRRGLVEEVVEGKEKYYEITAKGTKYLDDISFLESIKNRVCNWDGAWRIVIFDIPEKKKESRNNLRANLVKNGFKKIQESVYAFPFECSSFIKNLSEKLLIKKNVLIMIADIIQGEEAIIEYFLDKNILNRSDIQVLSKSSGRIKNDKLF